MKDSWKEMLIWVFLEEKLNDPKYLQLLAQEPDFTMFDEPDSGVDIENVELLAEEINILLDKKKKPGLREKSGLLITHLGYILNFVAADTAHVLMDGKIACSGNPS